MALNVKSHLEDIEKLDAILTAERFCDDDSQNDSTDSDVTDESPYIASIQDLQNVRINFTEFSTYDEQVNQIVSTCTNANLQTVLILNRAQQALIIEALGKYRELLFECIRKSGLIKRAIKELTEKCYVKPHPSFYRCGVPFFKDRFNRHCPPNQDQILKTKNGELSLVDLPPLKFWLAGEKEKLVNSVYEQSREIRINEIELEKKLVAAKFMRNPVDNSSDYQAKVNELDNQIKYIQKKTVRECVFPVSNKNVPIDWMKISAQVLNGRHGDEESKAMWYIHLHPDINKDPFEHSEFAKLTTLAEKYKTQNWEQIALELGNNRSGYFCCLTYLLKMSEKQCLSKWTSEEDAYLLEIIENCRIGNFIPWGTAAYYMKNRTKHQIYNRYIYALRPEIKKGKFSKQEDILVLALMEQYGKDFPKIAAHIPNRTPVQIRDRYLSVLQYNGKSCGAWTLGEDRQIEKFVNEHGGRSWSLLSKIFKSDIIRTRNHLRHRWNTLRKHMEKNPVSGISTAPRHKSKKKTKAVPKAKIKQVLDYMKNSESTACESKESETGVRKIQRVKVGESSYNLKAVNEALGIPAAVPKDVEDDSLEKFRHIFLQSFHKVSKCNKGLLDDSIFNLIFILQIIDARVQVDRSYINTSAFKYSKEYQKSTIIKFLDISELFEKNTDSIISLLLQEQSPKSQSTASHLLFKNWNRRTSLSDMLPATLRTAAGFQATLLACKNLVKLFVWHDTVLHCYYSKKNGRFVKVRKDLFQTEAAECPTKDILSIEDLQDHLNSRILTQRFAELLPCDDCQKYDAVTTADTFKQRFLSFFSLPALVPVVQTIIEEFDNISLQTPIADKEPTKRKKKVGRPKKVLPGGRIKYKAKPPKTDDIICNDHTNDSYCDSNLMRITDAAETARIETVYVPMYDSKTNESNVPEVGPQTETNFQLFLNYDGHQYDKVASSGSLLCPAKNGHLDAVVHNLFIDTLTEKSSMRSSLANSYKVVDTSIDVASLEESNVEQKNEIESTSNLKQGVKRKLSITEIV